MNRSLAAVDAHIATRVPIKPPANNKTTELDRKLDEWARRAYAFLIPIEERAAPALSTKKGVPIKTKKGGRRGRRYLR